VAQVEVKLVGKVDSVAVRVALQDQVVIHSLVEVVVLKLRLVLLVVLLALKVG
jgi:hypothetical protein